MSVLARMRKPSPYNYYTNAIKLRKSMRFLLLRDLGIKDKVREVHEFAKDMSEEDRIEFILMASKYNVERFSTEYPQWVIEKLRNAIWQHLDDILDHITYAYSVWPTSKAEYNHRRIEMDKAISSCQCLKKDLEGAIDILKPILQNNAVDVTGFEDKYTMGNVYNALDHYTASADKPKGKTILHKSLAIGAPISQIAGIYLPSRIDTWCKTVRSCKYYHAYMDDRVIIHHDKQFLREILAEITDIARTLGIHINSRKTQIIRLTHPFTFLKTRYILTDTGKLIKKIPKDVVKRQRRKMRKLAKLASEGTISLKEFQTQYKSWRGDKKRYHAYYTLRRLDSEEKELEEWIRNTRSTQMA